MSDELADAPVHRATQRPLGPHDNLAAVDLGSNSFHMVVGRFQGSELLIVDRLKEPVRLAAGLDDRGALDEAAQERALACLRKFGERLRGFPAAHVRAVGTNTLRRAKNGARFLRKAERALGHRIEVVSGIEEARLIYVGVSQALEPSEAPRLVVDVGGGSTEVIVGKGAKPVAMESLYVGCVGLVQQCFADGKLGGKRWRKASLRVAQELEPVVERFRKIGWERAYGSSGSMKAAADVAEALGRGRGYLDRAALADIRERALEAGAIEALQLPGLADSRRPVFVGGIVILETVFEALGIERMEVSDQALREGLLYEQVDRIRHADVRTASVSSLQQRFHVDAAQAARVEATARQLVEQVATAWKLDPDLHGQIVAWAARLHEIGVDIAHSHYHRHGAYVIEHADLAGFSKDEQAAVATLIRGHRRRPMRDFGPVDAGGEILEKLCILLRLAVLLHRSRRDEGAVPLRARAKARELELELPAKWLDARPLTAEDLRAEAEYLDGVGFALRFG